MEVEQSRIRQLAIALIDSQSTMTLATASADDAWAAPVYYVYYRAGFYFFSDPASRHIRQALAGGRTAAAIFASATTWQKIRGIQMGGAVQAVAAGMRAAGALGAYLRKFSFTREFFAAGEPVDLAAFSDRFKVRFYRFLPEQVDYTDNSIRFGFRQSVTLTERRG